MILRRMYICQLLGLSFFFASASAHTLAGSKVSPAVVPNNPNDDNSAINDETLWERSIDNLAPYEETAVDDRTFLNVRSEETPHFIGAKMEKGNDLNLAPDLAQSQQNLMERADEELFLNKRENSHTIGQNFEKREEHSALDDKNTFLNARSQQSPQFIGQQKLEKRDASESPLKDATLDLNERALDHTPLEEKASLNKRDQDTSPTEGKHLEEMPNVEPSLSRRGVGSFIGGMALGSMLSNPNYNNYMSMDPYSYQYQQMYQQQMMMYYQQMMYQQMMRMQMMGMGGMGYGGMGYGGMGYGGMGYGGMYG